jgi:hypothetical protein
MVKKYFSVFLLVVLLVGCSEQSSTEVNWEESAALVQEFQTQDGQKTERVFRMGDNGKFGIGEYGPFIAGQQQKYMWHFWGEKNILTKPFKVLAISKETGEEINVFELPINNSLAPNNGAHHHLPSSINIPNSGLWRLEVYFGDDLFGNIVVNVKEK